MAKKVPNRGISGQNWIMSFDMKNGAVYFGTDEEVAKQRAKVQKRADKKAEHHRIGMGLAKNYFDAMENWARSGSLNAETMKQHADEPAKALFAHYKTTKAASKAILDYGHENPEQLQRMRDLGLKEYFGG